MKRKNLPVDKEGLLNNGIITLLENFTVQKIASLLDVTDLKADSTEDKIREIAGSAIKNKCAAVCVNPVEVDILPLLLKNTDIRECYVLDFPLGKSGIKIKALQAEFLVNASRNLRGEGKGKIEIDMVINLGRFRTDSMYTLDEINSVCDAADGEMVKVIIRSPELDRREIVKISEIVAGSKAGFIKNSTGMDSFGAVPEHIKIMREVVGDRKGVKAAGGIKDALTALLMIKAGADKPLLQYPRRFRIGTSSPVDILNSFLKLKNELIQFD